MSLVHNHSFPLNLSEPVVAADDTLETSDNDIKIIVLDDLLISLITFFLRCK
jgi:hypothetical protein